MRIHAFVTKWNSPTCHAEETVERLSRCVPTMLLKSVYDRPFAEQWKKAKEYFGGDIFLWVMGDVTPPENLGEMVEAMKAAFATGEVAMYAPNIDWTSQIYNRDKLIQFSPNVYEVCGTDLLMCALHSDLLSFAPSIAGNSRAWFYDYALTAYANVVLQKKVVRDYNFLASHPQGSIYNMKEAYADAQAWLAKQSRGLQLEIKKLVDEQARLSL